MRFQIHRYTVTQIDTQIHREGLPLAILRNTDKNKYETQRTHIKQMACGKPEEHTKEHIFTRTILGNKEHQLAPISFPLSPRYVHPTQFPMTYEITADAVRSMFGTNIIQNHCTQRILVQRILHVTYSLQFPYGTNLPQTLTVDMAPSC
jgi:hypothetical protein